MTATEKARSVRPGFLVSLHTSIVGNRRYETNTLEDPHRDEEGEMVSKWETTRIVEDPEEYAAAVETRSKARGQVVNVCAATTFGLLCPLDREEKLLEGVKEMHRIADKFNADSRISTVDCRVIIGRVEQDDVEAIRAIEEETAKLLDGAAQAIVTKDPVAIGKFCDKARDLSAMLEDESKLTVKAAIDAARVAKRQMTKLIKAGDVAKIVVDQKILEQVKAARTSFLDIDSEEVDVQAPEVDAGPAVEMDDDEPVQMPEGRDEITETAPDLEPIPPSPELEGMASPLVEMD